MSKNPVTSIVVTLSLGAAIILGMGSFEVVSEGHVGIKKMFGRADAQLDPGLNFNCHLFKASKK